MSEFPPCPQCKSEYTYPTHNMMACPDCGHEWAPQEAAAEEAAPSGELVVKDANGAILQNGDSVVLIKSLDVKGAAKAIKIGTKVKNIRLVDGDHNIDCKIEGYGAMALKSEFVRKA